jgi:hypothetical protein
MANRGKGQPKRNAGHGNDPSPRDLEIYGLLCEGDTLREAAAQFKISHTAVANVRDKVERFLAPKFEQEIRQTKVRQTVALQKLFRDAMKAWNASRDGQTVELQLGEKSTIKSYPLGAVAYFDRAVKALSEIRAIWGVEKHFEMAGKEALNPAGMPRDEYRRKVAEAKISELQELVKELQEKGIE